MNIITETNLFGEREVTYTDPVTQKEITLKCEDFTIGVEHARKTAILNACNELYRRYEDYYTNLIKYSDIKGKAKHSINEARIRLGDSMLVIYAFIKLPDLAAHIYTNIYPILANCTVKSSIYSDLLHIIENQSFKYSAKHQFFNESCSAVNR